MTFFQKKAKAPSAAACSTQTGRQNAAWNLLDGFTPLSTPQTQLYYTLREAVPVIDAAICKLVRLVGGFRVQSRDPAAQELLDSFVQSVPVGGNQLGLDAFISTYLEQLLTCGTAVGEMVTDEAGRIAALFNAPLRDLELKRGENGLDVEVFVREGTRLHPVRNTQLLLLSTLYPEPGKLEGTSLLRGLPFVSSVLLKIFQSIGSNWDRIGNVRFAVTYKPQNDMADKTYAKERALQVAKEWGEAMQSGGTVKDFVAVGDVRIQVIGADCPIPDSEVPVRQMLEQIVAKTGLPPFMLGLAWSSTERMSSQQSDILTSELEAFRRILSPVICRICSALLVSAGFHSSVTVEWDDITLQDRTELCRAALYEMQAKKLEWEITKSEQIEGR